MQQKLDVSVTSSQKADRGIQTLQEALEASNNRVTDIHQQAVAHNQDLEEEARQEIQKIVELGREVETRANEAILANQSLQQTNAKQATEIETLQHEVQKWKDVAQA